MFQEAGTYFIDSGVTYTDNYYTGKKWDSLMKSSIIETGKVNTGALGTYEVGYYLKDPSGNAAIPVFRRVIVQDTTPPIVKLKGELTTKVEVFYPFNDPGFSFSDNLTKHLLIDTAGDFYTAFSDGIPKRLGLFKVNYIIRDSSGNTKIISRNIEVIDTIRPAIHLVGWPVVSRCRWSGYKDSGYYTHDNYYPDSHLMISIDGDSVNTNTKGFYSFRYRVEDSSHNVNYSEYRYINVLADNNPECISGIQSGSDNPFAVYPNPSSGLFRISGGSEIKCILITNILGQEIYYNDNRGFLRNFDLRNHPSGVYIVRIYTAKGIRVNRVEVER
jgi:hypothetical protein